MKRDIRRDEYNANGTARKRSAQSKREQKIKSLHFTFRMALAHPLLETFHGLPSRGDEEGTFEIKGRRLVAQDSALYLSPSI